MMDLIIQTYFIALLILIALFLWMAWLFKKEKEPAAFKKSILIAGALAAYSLLAYYFLPDFFILADTLALIFIILFFVWPFKVIKPLTDDYPLNQYDERDIMFSRKELIQGSERYADYYSNNPEKEKLDQKFRKEAGLLAPDSIYFHSTAFRIANTYFQKIDQLVPFINGKANNSRSPVTKEQITKKIKARILQQGALATGITACKPYHFYSHKGRGDTYGKKIVNTHNFAIAFTVEMDERMVAAAPKASIVMESAKQYYRSAKIAIEVAEYIRELGYDARAHIDGNYEVVCPLVARDAGLGEIGRMGILMTPSHGPRVRIGVITTSLELMEDRYKKDHAMLDFCNICKKCADCCPSNSIPFDEPAMSDGIKRWKIDSESCYTFWCKAGTDCGRCMAVCPYSHPDRSLHKLFRWGISHSKGFRRAAILMDDFFYGKKPAPKKIPELEELTP